MANVSKLLDEEVVKLAKRELRKIGSYGYVSKKLNAVIAASKHGITEVAKIYDISRTTLTAWIKYVKTNAIDKLSAPKSRHRPTKLRSGQMEIIKEWIESDPSITIKSLQIRVEETFKVTLGRSTIHRIMKKLRFSYITPRPQHYKQDPKLVEEFKKKSETGNYKP